MSNPICKYHNKPMTLRDGRFGKFWSCGTKNANGSWCNYKPPEPEGPVETFKDDLNRSEAMTQQNRKDAIITRIALAKSFIEAGRRLDPDTEAELEMWLAWVNRT